MGQRLASAGYGLATALCVCASSASSRMTPRPPNPFTPTASAKVAKCRLSARLATLRTSLRVPWRSTSKLKEAEDEGFEYFCPVLKTLPSTQMIGVARLTYRPHTRRTKGGSGELELKGRGWIEAYEKLAGEEPGCLPRGKRSSVAWTRSPSERAHERH